MNFGFVIDNRRCIGCHACSTACKSENSVPLGVSRTWVKTVEQGAYPDVRRSFQVTRCNHCANPPCVRICPTGAMYQRSDGIVEFARDSCIGCKSCMQACPYDAIYIDPETGTAAKCHYCAHRVDVGLEPACVVVCPVHAIIAGDLDDPESEISRTVADNQTTVRKPEQGTSPKLLYIAGNEISLHPTAFLERPSHMSVADVIDPGQPGCSSHAPQPTRMSRSGVEIRVPQAQGQPARGPVQIGRGRFAEHMVQLSYNAQHEIPWHWPVPAYLVTKAIGAGVFLFLALGSVLGLFEASPKTLALAGGAGVLATLATTALLVYDLERPQRFLYILLYPQWKSWLTRGAFVLVGFSTITGVWWAVELAAWLGWWSPPQVLRTIFVWVTLPLAIGTAIYTAFLFAQAEGRDLWQSPLLPFHLALQSLVMGAATLLVVSAVTDVQPIVTAVARTVLGAGLVLDLFVVLVGEVAIPHATDVAARAAHDITHGRYRHHFWLGSMAVGHVVPLALLWIGQPALAAVAGVLVGIGLYFYEHAFVMAPQRVANS